MIIQRVAFTLPFTHLYLLYAQRRVHPSKQFLTLAGWNALGSTQTITWLSSSDVPTVASIPPILLTPKRGKARGHTPHLFRYARVRRSGNVAIAIWIDTSDILSPMSKPAALMFSKFGSGPVRPRFEPNFESIGQRVPLALTGLSGRGISMAWDPEQGKGPFVHHIKKYGTTLVPCVCFPHR
jgi:hypothetical protein